MKSAASLTSVLTGLFVLIFTTVHVKAIALTEPEKLALDKFRPIAENLVYEDYMKADRYLLRFLRARDLKVEDATEMLTRMLEWRKAEKIDTLLQEDFTAFDDQFKFILPGADKEGHPLVLSLLGTYDLRKFALGGKLPQVIRFFDRMLELGEADLRRRIALPGGENINGTVFVFDLNGFNLRKQACALCISIIPHYFQALERYYPQYVHRLFLLNTPSIFLPILDIIKPFLSKATTNALRVHGHNRDEWRQALLNEIDADQLPIHFGGTIMYDSLHTDWRTQNPEVAALIARPKPKT